MAAPAQLRRRASYGVDAPFWKCLALVLAVVELVLAIVNVSLGGKWWPLLPALFVTALAAYILYTTLRGKFLVLAELVDGLKLRGDEHILDLGCGRGTVLMLAARCLTTGRAVGVDVWRGADQSGNSAEATRRNAVAEGVADRVELHTADMRALPLEDGRFDVVVSSLAIHNIRGRAEREKAIDEAVRVLRPGGRLMIADVRFTGQYRAHLARIGMSDVACRGLGWRFWPSFLVSATKAERGG
jgi:SAM-dependent methyltransferase